MRFLELIKTRQSVRKYISRPVSREILTRCLEAARLAPSACNSQPWYFIVVDDEDLRKRIGDAAFSGIYAMNSHAKTAPVLVAVVRDNSRYGLLAKFGGLTRNVQYGLVDIAIACEHFVLQAADEGVGTCWLGWFNERAVKRILGVPWDKRVDMLFSVGYPAETEVRSKTRAVLGEMSRFNQ